MIDILNDWDSRVPFAQRAWHRCPSCRHDDGRGIGGSPPWHTCLIKVTLPFETNRGVDCARYAPLPWAVSPETVTHRQGKQP